MILEKEFCDFVNGQLKQLKWSRSDLARAMGCTPQYVTDYLNGRSVPGPAVMERFCGALGLEPHLTFKPIVKQSTKKVGATA